MAKLYPPHIEGSLPAFCGSVMRIPFEHSRAVSPDYDIQCFYYILKDIQQSKIIASSAVSKNNINVNADGTYELLCPVNSALVSVGTFYKCQLAYMGHDNQVGYYSDVGIIKYIQEPEVKLTGLSQMGPNTHQYHYQLWYNCKDSTEKLYSTQFVIAKGTQTNPYLYSEEIIHNTTKDSYYDGFEDYDFLQELSTTENYWIYALVTTTSGYQMTTPFYPLSAQIGIPNLNNWKVNAKLDYDNGCMAIYCYSETGAAMGGKFKLARADEKEGYIIWHNLIETELNETGLTISNPLLLWRDFTIEQGQYYIYGLFQVSADGKISTKIKSDSVYADFEDSFLFDGDKQLRIRFDPKISSFKTTIQEAKTDTIGGRYPIIQRNANTNYKEFPISGLISHLSDEQGYFNQSIANLKLYDTENIVTDSDDMVNGLNYTTNLNSKNINLERQFKLEVLNWLNNGKPKLFRSPAEGNYIVRLLNISLSPNDVLGRMLHSFSCTAYEIDKMTIEKLVEHSIIKDYYLQGRKDISFNRNLLTYYLSNLPISPNNLLDNDELIGKEVTGVAFSVAKTPNPVYVNINGVDIEVSESANAIQQKTITSLSRPVGKTFNHLGTDLLTLSYRNVLSTETYNDYLADVISDNGIGQFNGMDLSSLCGVNIKNFLQKIYKLICNVRQILQPLKELTTSVLSMLGLSTDLLNYNCSDIKKLIQYLFNSSVIDSVIYCIKNSFGGIMGYIDGSTCSWIKEGGEIVKTAGACITFIYDKIKDPHSITKETIFTDFQNSLTNIIANPFTCVDIIYKTATNTFNNLTGLEDVTSSLTCGLENVFANLSNDITPVKIASNLVSSGETILSTITSSLGSNGIINIPISMTDSSNASTVDDFLTKSISTASELASLSVSVLSSANQSNTSGCSSNTLVNTASATLKTLTSVMSGLFGGFC